MAGHSRPKDGVATLAYSRPKDGVATLAHSRPKDGVTTPAYGGRHRNTGVLTPGGPEIR